MVTGSRQRKRMGSVDAYARQPPVLQATGRSRTFSSRFRPKSYVESPIPGPNTAGKGGRVIKTPLPFSMKQPAVLCLLLAVTAGALRGSATGAKLVSEQGVLFTAGFAGRSDLVFGQP